MAPEPFNALLVDVGGTLGDDARWLERDPYQALMISRLRDAFGTDLPWFALLERAAQARESDLAV